MHTSDSYWVTTPLKKKKKKKTQEELHVKLIKHLVKKLHIY